MAKLNKPLFSLTAFGQITRGLIVRRRGSAAVLEAKPYPKDAKTSAQLSWRTMYQLAITLWHALPAAEKKAWESVATPHHMTGYAYFLSQALRPNPGIYLPLAGGTMSGNIAMASNRITALPAPTTDQEPARKLELTTHAALTTGAHGISGTIAGTSDTQTFTNKRTQPRVSSAASGDISPDISAADFYVRTALAAALTINNPTGSPAEGEKLILRLKDNATARAISWGAQYRAIEFALPTTTVLSKTLYMGFIFNITDTKWDLVAVNQQA